MSDRQIGRVVSVDNFRVFVKLDDDLTSTHKSGFNDIYEVARINSYLIIPVGSDRIVALITRVKMQEEPEFDKNKQSISLPSSSRYITATMLGTIETRNNKEIFIQGVYNFPVLDNVVWFITADDLNKIFDYNESSEIDYSKDFYLPIGNSPAFPDYDVKICPDQLFVKHTAILGNTGSGKSCTLTSILKSIFNYKFKTKVAGQTEQSEECYLKNAHFIIFDTNGEYKNAFISEGEQFERINTLVIDDKGLKVPYWFMNWDDFDYLFEPGSGTQAPILKRAIGLAKNITEAKTNNLLNKVLEGCLVEIINSACGCEEWKFKAKREKDKNFDCNNQILQLSKELEKYSELNLRNISEKLKILGKKDLTLTEKTQSINEIELSYKKYKESLIDQQIMTEKNIDLPVWFKYQELITKYIDSAIEEHEGSSSKISEYVSTLRLRLEGFFNDRRIADPLLLNIEAEFTESLIKFISFIFGDFYRSLNNNETDVYSEYYNQLKYDQFENIPNKGKANQITILDMSLIPFDVLENLTGLIGRLIIEFVEHFKPEERGRYPIVIVLEEAQNYIPEKNRKDRESIAKKVFERIAREGRKYGISLIVSSQRPSELSKTVLSQCNSFIIHRLQNPDDQKYIKGLVSSANSDILDQLPILPQQHAIIMGDCVRTPVQMRINDISPKPNSDNPRFIEKWLESNNDFPDYKEICDRWEEGKK